MDKGFMSGLMTSDISDSGRVGDISLSALVLDPVGNYQFDTDNSLRWGVMTAASGRVSLTSSMFLRPCEYGGGGDCSALTWNVTDVFEYDGDEYGLSVDHTNYASTQVLVGHSTGKYWWSDIYDW